MESVSDIDLTEALSEPTYIVSGSGHAWFYSIEKKSMVMINRGVTCLPLDDTEASDKVLCQAGNEIVYIPSQEIVELGWN